jgi:hypothetical protein
MLSAISVCSISAKKRSTCLAIDLLRANSLLIFQDEIFSGAPHGAFDQSDHGSDHSDQDINSSASASSYFSATSAISFNHGLLLSALRAVHLELQRLNFGHRKKSSYTS